MAEEPLRQQDARPQLRYLAEQEPAAALQRKPREATELAEAHAWVVDRMMGRIAAHWPEQIDLDWLRGHAVVALQRAAATVADVEDLPVAGVQAVGERLQRLLAGTEWYREAMVGRARPLCEAWRGAVLGGREPTDHTLCDRLYIGPEELARRFVELGAVFAVEPAALLPRNADLEEAVATVIGELPGEQQLAASLYFQQQLTVEEIAEVMGLLPVRAQELLGRAAAAISGEATLGNWPGRDLTA